MILVGQYDSPYVRRVAITMHTLGLPFTRNTFSVFGDADAMRRINPLGRVPSLILDGGETLIDSAAILDHLDEVVGPEKALVPRSGADRRRALKLIATATGVMDKAIAIMYETALRPEALQHPPWVERNATQLSAALSALEAEAPAPWLMGARFSQADITVGCSIAYLRLRGLPAFSVAPYPKLARFADTLEALPAFKATRPSADETMPARS